MHSLSLLEKAHHSAILNDSYKLLNEVLHKQSLQLEMIVKYLHIVTDSEKRKDWSHLTDKRNIDK